MSELPMSSEDPLTRLLAEHLRKQEETTETNPMLSRIRIACEVAQNPPAARSRRWVRWGMVVMPAAAIVLIAMGIFFIGQPAQARAEAVLREARQTLRIPVERCYLVDIERDGPEEMGAKEEILPARTVRVWAARDRFRVEITRGNYRWSWGRAQDGSVWLNASPRLGIRIEPDEIGPGLMRACDLCGLQSDTLLGELLAHCDLREQSESSSPEERSIRAVPRRGYGLHWLRFAIIDLDRETRAIRKLTLRRLGTEGKVITQIFTLIETRPIDEARYRLEGHLSEPFQIYDREFHPQKRREILARWVGVAMVDRWLLPVAKK
jgi:hypothetical protein